MLKIELLINQLFQAVGEHYEKVYTDPLALCTDRLTKIRAIMYHVGELKRLLK